ncbi:hypothetical protein ACP4OV_010811 [Aristida adscensionis]
MSRSHQASLMRENSDHTSTWRVLMLVQGLVAAGVQEPPNRYVRHEQDGPGLPVSAQIDAADMPEPVPMIDLARLQQNEAEEAAKLRSALQSWGLFGVSNHGIESSLIDDVMNAREFFRGPLDEKQKCSNLAGGKHFQVEGYGNDQVKILDQIMDWSDRLHLRVEPLEERNLAKWPTHPESFRNVLHEYTLKSRRVKCIILETMARLLGLSDDYFLKENGNKAPVTVRINHYLPCPRPDLVLGFKPHSDDGVLTTLLVDNDLAALQVLKDGLWYNVPTKPHILLVNTGDFMEIMSNGIFKSPIHRVVTDVGKERISLAMFYGFDSEKEIEPAANLLLHEKQPARYKKIKTEDYMAEFYEHFARGTRVIDFMKI